MMSVRDGELDRLLDLLQWPEKRTDTAAVRERIHGRFAAAVAEALADYERVHGGEVGVSRWMGRVEGKEAALAEADSADPAERTLGADDPACENRRLHVRIAELETEQEILLNLVPHNDVWDDFIDKEYLKQDTKEGHHSADPKPCMRCPRPTPCRRCLAEATLKGEEPNAG